MTSETVELEVRVSVEDGQDPLGGYYVEVIELSFQDEWEVTCHGVTGGTGQWKADIPNAKRRPFYVRVDPPEELSDKYGHFIIELTEKGCDIHVAATMRILDSWEGNRVTESVDRRAKVVLLDDGTYEIEGVAYVADEPNVNGVTYSKAALEGAFTRLMNASFRPVTIGCNAEPKLSDCVGEMVGWSVDGNAFSVTLKTLPNEKVRAWVGGMAATDDLAIAGACVTAPLDFKRVETIDRIISFGLVRVDEVTPEEDDDG